MKHQVRKLRFILITSTPIITFLVYSVTLDTRSTFVRKMLRSKDARPTLARLKKRSVRFGSDRFVNKPSTSKGLIGSVRLVNSPNWCIERERGFLDRER
ncbi:hypothetical protein HanIR_Chr07g0333031 [Helianthus annuus]|nr:hypothetical protein HanIR_Chr07g0333031 [Helianthus annuus]